MSRDWVDYTSAAGSIATALTLIYIIIKEIATRRQVQDLTVLAVELQEQGKLMKEQNELQRMVMKNQVRPHFEHPKTVIGTDAVLGIHLTNTGHRTYIVKTRNDNTDVDVKPILEQVVEENKSLLIKMTGKNGKNIYECFFDIQLLHSDVYGNEYLTEIMGTGSTIESFNTFESFERW